ncbi:hypothetical protein M1247_26260 [Mycobacterium sp. 21AC1]|uniref:hypothetical protein n=1 Tax=[Mycobacterium] appelbergii TaxID=2939269 RepID=UPI002938E1AF|nr:hypothetical protein [Mycobacterium sp. 21AC1]MDV3128442.1 hypothetical protein [Mycobacterium sp. 21AC1]
MPNKTTSVWGGCTTVRAAAACITSVALIVSGCSSSGDGTSESGSGAQGTAPGTVRIGMSQGFILNQMTTMLAQGLGYYREVEEEFDTKISLEVQSTNTMGQSAFFGDSIDFYQGSISGLLPPASKAEDVMSIFTHYTGTATVMIGASKYESSRGTDVNAYNGANWCFTTLGSNSEVTSRYVAKDAGLDWSQQSALAVGNTSALLPTLQVGRCDIAAMDTNSAAQAVAEGLGYVVENPLSEENQERVFGGSVLGLVTWASERFTAQYLELTQAIVEAQLRSVLFQQEHRSDPAALYAALPDVFTETTSEEQFTAGWELFSLGVPGNTGGPAQRRSSPLSSSEMSLERKWVRFRTPHSTTNSSGRHTPISIVRCRRRSPISSSRVRPNPVRQVESARSHQ